MNASMEYRVFNLVGVRNNAPFKAILVSPELVDFLDVTAAWSYAIRYTAKGLDIPDYEAAVKMLMQRHPAWKIFVGEDVASIGYDPQAADSDKPG